MEIISEQVKKFIGNKEILKGINIDVKNKEFLGIIGPNGSGKSTFLKCIYRILKPSEGKILERDNEIDYKIARNALEKVGLKDFVERNFTTLSGGEQQRVILARALTQETECLVLDEPTNHLDIKYQLQIMDIVKSLNLTVIAAIHDLNIASMYCDRLIALKNGKIVGEGSPKKLLTENFIKDIYEVETKVEMLNNGSINIRYLPNHWQENLLMDYNKN